MEASHLQGLQSCRFTKDEASFGLLSDSEIETGEREKSSPLKPLRL